MRDDQKKTVGAFIDIDGVVMKGGKPFEHSSKDIKKLWSNNVPCLFVTNGTYCSDALVKKLATNLQLPITSDHIVVAPSPCAEFTDLHDKHVLLVCQEDCHDLAKELGFKSFVTIPDLVKVFPELDYIDHQRRKNLPDIKYDESARANFRPIEAILLLDEPIAWERALQIVLDVLLTNGDVRPGTVRDDGIPKEQLPVIACNKDLTFKGAAELPRFGHGAFLECLEHLHEKMTKHPLKYTHITGKPQVITYEYATRKLLKLLPEGTALDTIYCIGDNPYVDIKGANVYKKHLESQEGDAEHPQVESILVCTGVYRRECDLLYHLRSVFDARKVLTDKMVRGDELRMALARINSYVNFFEDELNIPDVIVETLDGAVDIILGEKLKNKEPRAAKRSALDNMAGQVEVKVSA